jgi:hypothetical protein
MRIHPRELLLALLLTTSLTGQTIVNTIAHNGSFPGGVAFDAVTNEVIVIDSTASTVTFYDRVTGAQHLQLAAPGTQVIGGQVDVRTGNVWICSEAELVFEIDRAGTILTQWSCAPTISDASALTIDPASDTIWISNDSAHVVAEFAKNGTPTGNSFVPSGSVDGDGCVYDPYTRTFLMGEDTGDQILVVSRTGALVRAVPLAALGISPEGLAIDTTMGTVFIGNGLVSTQVFEVSGVINAPPPGAVTHYGTAVNARIASSDALRDDGATAAGTWIGYQAALPPGGFFGLNAGFARQSIPLGTFLPSPCTLYAMGDIFSLLGQTNSNGRYGLRLPIPPGLQGLTLTFWGADFDLWTLSVPNASGGLEVVVQ